jgi:hypothetical protein
VAAAQIQIVRAAQVAVDVSIRRFNFQQMAHWEILLVQMPDLLMAAAVVRH